MTAYFVYECRILDQAAYRDDQILIVDGAA
jgi:hypothetical protein